MLKCLNCPQLGKNPFCSLGSDAQAFLEESSTELSYPQGSIIFREGDQSHAVYFLCSGKVKLCASSKDGRTMILRIAQTGEVLGISAALAKGEFEVTAEVLEPSSVRVLKIKDFDQMLHRYEEASAAAAKSLVRDYKAAFDDARMLALSSSAKSRLAMLILGWSATNAKLPVPAAFIKMTFTHDDLGAMTATSRETMTRALGQLQRDKIIAVHGIALTVLNPSALEAYATS